MTTLTPDIRRVLEGKNFVSLATVMPDGSPQVSNLWFEFDGEHIYVNTSMGRVKQRNTKRDPRVALAITEQDNPYSEVVIRGRVVDQMTNGAREHANKLSERYTGKPWNPPANQTRVILKIKPDRVVKTQ
jgi:PPOX class probable F420-dependent enzyme